MIAGIKRDIAVSLSTLAIVYGAEMALATVDQAVSVTHTHKDIVDAINSNTDIQAEATRRYFDSVMSKHLIHEHE